MTIVDSIDTMYIMGLHHGIYTRCYFNVCSKADISQLDLLHGTDK